MKIYLRAPLIKNIKVDDLKKQYEWNNHTSYQFYTDSGLFVQRNNKLFKMNVIDVPVKHTETNGTTFCIDPSYYTQTEWASISVDHVMFHVYSYVFKVKNIDCVIEGKMTASNFQPTDMFFVPKSRKKGEPNVDSETFNSINEFLSFVM